MPVQKDIWSGPIVVDIPELQRVAREKCDLDEQQGHGGPEDDSMRAPTGNGPELRVLVHALRIPHFPLTRETKDQSKEGRHNPKEEACMNLWVVHFPKEVDGPA